MLQGFYTMWVAKNKTFSLKWWDKEVHIYWSKTKIKQGLQCSKSLYLQVKQPQLAREFSAQEKNLFDQGYRVQKAAQDFFANGISIQTLHYWDFQSAHKQTQEALKKKPPYIYEACFLKDDWVVRIDILQLEEDKFNIIEVKSSGYLKEDHVWDVAIQKYIFNQMGYDVQNCYVLHINKASVYPNLKDLFIQKNINERVEDLQSEIHQHVGQLKETMSEEQVPPIEIGTHCKRPYPCRFIDHCWKSVPKPSVFDIPRIGEQAWEYYNEGHIDLKSIPDEDLVDQQKMYKKVHLTQKPVIQKDKIQKEISKWKWPFYYLDFETLTPPIPYLEGTRPFQDIPFQFHCLYQKSVQDKISSKEYAYLHPDISDPRRAVAQNLVKHIGKEGSILAYYKNFESKQLKNLAEYLPEFREDLLDIESRLEDPLPLLREAVCYKEFGSSWSLKVISPVLLGEKWAYSSLEVQDGLAAQKGFKEMILLKDLDKKEQKKKDLIEYCRQDTLCLALLVQWLFQQVQS